MAFATHLQRKLPSPGFQVEIVLVDHDPAAVSPQPPSAATENTPANSASNPTPGPVEEATAAKDSNKDRDDEFSDSDSEEATASSKSGQTGNSPQATASATAKDAATPQNNADPNQVSNLTRKTGEISIGSSAPAETGKETVGGSGMSSSAGEVSEFKAMAADASIFSFGDDDDDESE